MGDREKARSAFVSSNANNTDYKMHANLDCPRVKQMREVRRKNVEFFFHHDATWGDCCKDMPLEPVLLTKKLPSWKLPDSLK